MFGSTLLEITIGLVVVFWFVSILSTALAEVVASVLSWRASTLRQAIERLLQGTDLAAQIHAHPLIRALARNDGASPSYIPANTFAIALLDVLTTYATASLPDVSPPRKGGGGPSEGATSVATPTPPIPVSALVRAIQNGAPTSPLATLLTHDVLPDLRSARDVIACWFDEGMDRASGWYKRRTRWCIALLALLVSVGLDVDALRVGAALARQATLGEAIVAVSSHVVTSPGSDATTPLVQAARIDQELAALPLPIARQGRAEPWFRPSSSTVLGWLITALAASLGAPFWFDLLNKFVNLRNAGGLPDKSPSPDKKG